MLVLQVMVCFFFKKKAKDCVKKLFLEQVGDWNNGQASFQDPLLPGYIIMYVNMTFFGSFYCSASDPPTTFIALLNGKFEKKNSIINFHFLYKK